METASHTWTCPTCGRRVPLRAEVCHCGMSRERAREVADTRADARAHSRPGRPPARPSAPRPPLPGDVKALLAGAALVTVAGLGWFVLGPRPADNTPRLLGYVDAPTPPVPKPTPIPKPPFKLPWWK